MRRACGASVSAWIRWTAPISKKSPGATDWREVLASIRLARELGMEPVKVNAVIIRGINDHEIEALADFAREQELALRFIEFMPLDSARAWQKELVCRAARSWSGCRRGTRCGPPPPKNPSETAKRWAFADGRGEIGLISPVSEPFCGHCNRIRLTADGKIRTCLFSVVEHDLRSRLRDGDSDADIADYLQSVVVAEGGAASHRRAGFCRAGTEHELHRGMKMHCDISGALDDVHADS